MDPVAIAREGVEAFSAGDWERFKASLADDSVYEEPATHRRVSGVEEITSAVQVWKEAFPDAKGTIKKAIGSGGDVTLEITWEGTQSKPLEGPGGTIPASGNHVVLDAVQVIRVEGGKVTENRHFFDMLSMLQQMDAAPS